MIQPTIETALNALVNKSCIYQLTFNDKSFYIGRTKNLQNRIKQHISNMTSKSCDQIELRSKYKKYGMPKLSILEFCELEQLKELEHKHIMLNANKYRFINQHKGVYKPLNNNYQEIPK